jgi:ParB family chromosome partitioning protein
MEILQIDPKKIKPNPYQPRRRFAPAELEELIASIKDHGILQPLILTRQGEELELLAGERRLRAALALRLSTVPAIIQETKEKDEKLELALIENIQRQDLNPIERARAFQRLVEEFHLTQEEVAKRLGKPRTSIANTLRLLVLPEEVQRAITEGTISEGHGKILAAISDPKRQKELAEQIIGQSLSVRNLEKALKKPSGAGSTVRLSDAALQETVEALEQKLATRVRVIIGKNKQGKIVIRFWSPEELEAILKAMAE